MNDDTHRKNPGVWQGYISAGRTMGQRAERLREAPKRMQPRLRQHLAMVDRLRWQHYAAAGRTLSERRARIAEAPEELQGDVKRHLQRLWRRKRRAA